MISLGKQPIRNYEELLGVNSTHLNPEGSVWWVVVGVDLTSQGADVFRSFLQGFTTIRLGLPRTIMGGVC